MSRDITAAPAGQRAGTGRSQATLRDHLNAKVAPYLKMALIDGLNTDVEYPLQWLGEHLIYLSMLHEGNPDTTNIESHFKYNHDAPAPIKTEESSLQPEQQEQEAPLANGPGADTVEPAYLNGMASSGTHEDQTTTTNGTNASEILPEISETPAEDTEMQGAP